MCIACTTTKKIIFTWKKIPWSLLPSRILEPLQNTVLTKQERCEILWIFWILWINHMDQITWIKLSGSNYLDQIVWIKLSGSNYLDQIIWIKLSGSNHLDQIIWIKLSGSNYYSKYFARSQNLYQNILQAVKPYIKIFKLFWKESNLKLKYVFKIFCKESNLISKYSKYRIIFENVFTTTTYQNIKNSQMQIRIL